MNATRHHLDWVRANILEHLSRVDRVIAEMVPSAAGVPGVRGDEPWVERLFARRQSVQSKLFEVERQIEQRRTEPVAVATMRAFGDDR